MDGAPLKPPDWILSAPVQENAFFIKLESFIAKDSDFKPQILIQKFWLQTPDINP